MKAMDLLTKLNAIYEGTVPSVELVRHKVKMTKKQEKLKLHLISKAA
jgi:hypothetical protein